MRKSRPTLSLTDHPTQVGRFLLYLYCPLSTGFTLWTRLRWRVVSRRPSRGSTWSSRQVRNGRLPRGAMVWPRGTSRQPSWGTSHVVTSCTLEGMSSMTSTVLLHELNSKTHPGSRLWVLCWLELVSARWDWCSGQCRLGHWQWKNHLALDCGFCADWRSSQESQCLPGGTAPAVVYHR